MNKIIEAIPLPPLYYNASDTTYWKEDAERKWIRVNESSAKNYIAEFAYSKSGERGDNSEVERCLLAIQSKRNVAYVGPLAGYPSGIHKMAGNLVLVTTGPKWIQPKLGTWPTIEKLVQGLFMDVELDQRPYVYGWLKYARSSLVKREWRASQLFTMAGPVGSGKSLLQLLITEALGGRSVKPYQFMMGETTFNSHLFKGEHLMLEDENEAIDIKSRRRFAANIKTLLVSRDQNCHGKNREALTLQPLWRMTLTVNDDPERLLVLPPFDADIKDKIICLKANRVEMPMKTGTDEEKASFWKTLMNELPAFLHFIDQYEVPTHLRDGRYGIAAYQHPSIVEDIQETTPAMQLLELIDAGLWGTEVTHATWEGSSGEMERILSDRENKVCHEAKRLFSYPKAAGSYLAKLRDTDAEPAKGRVKSRKVNGYTVWTIEPVQKQTLPIRPKLK